MHGLVAATWAHGFSRSLCIDNPSLTAEFGVYNPDAGTGLRIPLVKAALRRSGPAVSLRS